MDFQDNKHPSLERDNFDPKDGRDPILRLAVQDFINRSLNLGLQAEWRSLALEALHLSDWPVLGAWSPVGELWILEALEAFENELVRARVPQQAVFDAFKPGIWTLAFGVAELRNRVTVDREMDVELWSTRAVRYSWMAPGRVLYALRATAVAETHQIGSHGWHIHPTKHGKHLGYRLLFDATRTQNDLAWESHAHGNAVPGGSQPFGDPALVVLGSSQSKALHGASLHACKGAAKLRHRPFKEWASLFVNPGSDTYVAHPAPAAVQLW